MTDILMLGAAVACIVGYGLLIWWLSRRLDEQRRKGERG